MKVLAGRVLEIVSGKSGLPLHAVRAYREKLGNLFTLPDIVEQHIPGASTLGTQLLAAFKSALGKDIPCGTCRQLLLSWNQSESIDVADATDKIYRISLEIPETICGRNPVSQRQWIRGVIESVKGKHNDRVN